MKSQNRPSLLALSALLLCALRQAAGSHRSSSASSSEVTGRSGARTAQDWLTHTDSGSDGNRSHEHVGSFNTSTVTPGRAYRAPGWSPEEAVSPVCAYRMIEGGIGGQLCFRNTLIGYKCRKGECRTAVSAGSLVANILVNGSVLLQWTGQDAKAKQSAAGANATRDDSPPTDSAFGGRRHRRGGYELSCWWNGSYTQFECAGVHLGSGCTDFLLVELHENIPYRLCLRPLARSAAARRDCVEFTLPPSGMQDIVIAMTTVGGAICVMLVIICLLVAYITENIMSPSTQHTYSYRTHSRH
ncbi:fibronectin type III domain-containing protein 10 [Salarias fasciatus]|uniref:fibronectin type III domain-containing protein 10 n=1 Tax=Salarias fasciatus TaxID=181472 RepID=UPI0011768187|nr:fibronectin type III domain-containing protein 10 [Salarias fasciatus]